MQGRNKQGGCQYGHHRADAGPRSGQLAPRAGRRSRDHEAAGLRPHPGPVPPATPGRSGTPSPSTRCGRTTTRSSSSARQASTSGTPMAAATSTATPVPLGHRHRHACRPSTQRSGAAAPSSTSPPSWARHPRPGYRAGRGAARQRRSERAGPRLLRRRRSSSAVEAALKMAFPGRGAARRAAPPLPACRDDCPATPSVSGASAASTSSTRPSSDPARHRDGRVPRRARRAAQRPADRAQRSRPNCGRCWRGAGWSVICALVVEPMVQAARPPRARRGPSCAPAHSATSSASCIIADEVATRIGEPGGWCAISTPASWLRTCSPAARGLTGGYLPLSAVLATNEVFHSFLGAPARRTFFHGHTCTRPIRSARPPRWPTSGSLAQRGTVTRAAVGERMGAALAGLGPSDGVVTRSGASAR